ncbi:MAG: hypothetical protein ACI9XO_004402 [Paraglaciecola sp.]|jgi:hypothetical protein
MMIYLSFLTYLGMRKEREFILSRSLSWFKLLIRFYLDLLFEKLQHNERCFEQNLCFTNSEM